MVISPLGAVVMVWLTCIFDDDVARPVAPELAFGPRYARALDGGAAFTGCTLAECSN